MLYGLPADSVPFKLTAKHKKRVALFVREFDGVAYTTNSDDEAEIHLSGKYICGLKTTEEQVRDEVLGVLYHEMVSAA
jgi:hypothetical protein